MSNFVFSRPLGDDMSPFGFLVCCEDPYSTATIVAGVQNLSNTIANDKMANAQREFEADESELAYLRQRELMNDQFAYAERMWNQNNAYNTPKEQSKRLREAHLNPYAFQGTNYASGVSNSPASTPSAPGVAKASAPGWSNPQQFDLSQLLLQGSSLKNDRMRAFADLVESYPKILEACNGDVSKAASIMKSLSSFSGLSGDKAYQNILNQYAKNEADAISASVYAGLAKKYGDRQAFNMISQSEATINESLARVRKMASDASVNDATIEKIGSEIARNVAEAWKLRKEGNKFVADVKTVNSLRKYLVSQYRSQANMMDLESLLSGAEPDTDLNDFFTSGSYMRDLKEGKRITRHWNANPIYRGFDKFFGDYIKIMGSPASGGSSTETMYHTSPPSVKGF